MRFSLMVLVFGLAAACSSNTKSPGGPEVKVLPAVDKGAPSSMKTPAADKVVEPMATAKTECTTKGDTRTLELRAKGKGCELAYTKNGQEGIVASAANGNAYCETTLNKIRDRLKGSGFECK